MQIGKKIKDNRVGELLELASMQDDEHSVPAVRANRVRRPAASDAKVTTHQFIVVHYDKVSFRAGPIELADVRPMVDTFTPKIEVRPNDSAAFTIPIIEDSPEIVTDAWANVRERSNATTAEDSDDAAGASEAPSPTTKEADSDRETAPTIGSELRQLAELHQAGLLSEDEFAAAKQRLLDS